MAAFLYKDNVSPKDRFNKIELQLDSGSTAIIERGKSYELSATEITRVQRFIVLQPVSGIADSTPVEIVRLPVVGTPEEGDIPVWSNAYGAFVVEPDPGGGGGGGTPGDLPTLTADTFEPYRVIMLAVGNQLKAIPSSTPVPGVPTSLSTVVRLSSVHLSWNAPGSAISGTKYALWRNGVQVFLSEITSYRDIAISSGSSYSYQVQTVDPYGQRSAKTAAVNAFIDPAINSAPTVTVRAWPATFPTNGRTVLRVNASDVDAQALALALSVNTGTIAATGDPSVWIYTP
jgi:hypothetical protein